MTDLNVLRQRLTAAVTDINRLTDELEQVRAQLTGAQQQVKQYQDGYRALEAELAARPTAAELNAARDGAAAAQRREQTANAAMHRYLGQRNQLQRQVIALQQELARLQEQHAAPPLHPTPRGPYDI